jgi:hypothetical protein
MIYGDECGAFGGTKIGRETEVLGKHLPQCLFNHDKFQMTLPGLESGPPQCETSD